MQEAVESSLNSRLQELEAKSAAAEERERSANERLSQTLSQMNVLEAQISCLRSEQTQLTKSYRDHVSQLQEEIRELKTKLKIEHEALAHQDIEHKKAARLELEITPLLQSIIVPEQNSISIKSTHDNGMTGEVKDIPEVLKQLIQSQMPVKESARTGVLSKSWLHAWSTNPTLKFDDVSGKKSMKLVDRTLKRYFDKRISLEKFDLVIEIKNPASASRVKNWIRSVATKTCLKEFSVSADFCGASSTLTLPDELLLAEKLTKINVSANDANHDTLKMTTSIHPLIKCVSLRELHLDLVNISKEVLQDIFLSCKLLVKIELIDIGPYNEFKNLKVKNLPCLSELGISLFPGCSTALEISDVPNLRVFRYETINVANTMNIKDLPVALPFNASTHSMSLRNVTELTLGGVVPDSRCLDMITSEFPFLESLTLDLQNWKLEIIHFTCASIKIFSLLCTDIKLSEVQIHAPNLLSFSFSGKNMPDLLLPVSSLGHFKLSLIDFRVEASFFIKMREALTLSPKCSIRISTFEEPDMSLFDIDDMRKRLVFPPATNVQQLEFYTFLDGCMWERSFFDAFFEICHPKHVFGSLDMVFQRQNHFVTRMLKEVLEKKTRTAFWHPHLKRVQIKQFAHEKIETLTNYRRSFQQGSAPIYFKLKWG